MSNEPQHGAAAFALSDVPEPINGSGAASCNMSAQDDRVGEDAQTRALPEHLAQLGDAPWALWRWVGLRGAGFPAMHVHNLVAAPGAAAADRLLESVDAAEQARERALATANAALDQLRSEQSWEDASRREPLLNALRGLKKGQTAPPNGCPPALNDAIEQLRAASEQQTRCRAHFRETFEAGTLQVAQAIYDLAQDTRFQEALIWQNRQAFHTAVALLQRPANSGDRGSKQRQHEELVASYVQRYCVKNDTIGFFGPVGWARIVAHTTALTAHPGAQLLSARKVSFEQWGIDALAEALARNRWLRLWLAPRRLPYVDLSGTTLYLPEKSPARLSAAQALVLHACTGNQSARALALALHRSHPFEIKSENEVYKLLEHLSSLGLIVWTLEVPFEHQPDQVLRRRLEMIGDDRLRRSALEALGALEAARDGVAAAAGDAVQLNQALGALETTFTHVTGVAPTRAAGATYAARTLVYEDCRRDIQVEIGPVVLQQLGPPLELLLTSARWFTYETAVLYRRLFHQLYSELSQASGSPIVEMTRFWQEVQMRIVGDGAPYVGQLLHMFQERWARVLALPPGQRRVAYSSAELRPQVQALFAAPRPGWQIARQHSPDVMIAAASVEHIHRGEYQLVMGELHTAANTLRGSLFVQQHPAPHELLQAMAHDLPMPRIEPVTPRHWPEINTRTRAELVTARDFRPVFSNDACGVAPEQVLPIGTLVLVDDGDGVLVRTRDGRRQFDIIEFFADILSLEIIDGFKIMQPHPHTPRVAVDRLVICRETWRFTPGAMLFANDKNEADRFLAARRWAREHGLPRCVFVKTPTERKPFYVDFDSPVLVNILAKLVRRSAERHPTDLISVSEMLPTLEQIWLPDADDQHYTSELRLVAVDLIT